MDRKTKLNRLIRLIRDMGDPDAEALIEELEHRLGPLDGVLPPSPNEIPTPQEVERVRLDRDAPTPEMVQSIRKHLLSVIQEMTERSPGSSLHHSHSYRSQGGLGISNPRMRTRIIEALKPEFETAQWILEEWEDPGMDGGFHLSPKK